MRMRAYHTFKGVPFKPMRRQLRKRKIIKPKYREQMA